MGLRSGEYLGRKTRRAPTARMALHRSPLVGAGIFVEDHSVARLEGRIRTARHKARKRSPLIGPSNRQGASMRSLAGRAARNRRGFPLALRGVLETQALSLRRRSCEAGPLLVLVHCSVDEHQSPGIDAALDSFAIVCGGD